jgi:hypothetical protein
MLATITTMASRTILHLRAAARAPDSSYSGPLGRSPSFGLEESLPPVGEWLGLRVVTWAGEVPGGAEESDGGSVPASPRSLASVGRDRSVKSVRSLASPRSACSLRSGFTTGRGRTAVEGEGVMEKEETTPREGRGRRRMPGWSASRAVERATVRALDRDEREGMKDGDGEAERDVVTVRMEMEVVRD